MKLDRSPSGYEGINWRRPALCANGECAEVGEKDDMILMRSTLTPDVIISYTAAEFRALRFAFHSGQFDDLG
jgi:hypothetical protein